MKNISITVGQGTKSQIVFNRSKTDPHFIDGEITKEKMQIQISRFEEIAYEALKKNALHATLGFHRDK